MYRVSSSRSRVHLARMQIRPARHTRRGGSSIVGSKVNNEERRERNKNDLKISRYLKIKFFETRVEGGGSNG